MSYAIEIEERAKRHLLRLPKAVIRRIRDAVVSLATDPRPPGAKKLTGRGGYRIRVGDYRLLYEIDDELKRLRIYVVGHRKNVYRKR